jgi:hypothetical protein
VPNDPECQCHTYSHYLGHHYRLQVFIAGLGPFRSTQRALFFVWQAAFRPFHPIASRRDWQLMKALFRSESPSTAQLLYAILNRQLLNMATRQTKC